MTLGEYRVGITFNPGGNSVVDKIKRMAADYIDHCEEMRKSSTNSEVQRLISMAQTDMEVSAMNAVKAATKPPRE